MDYIKNILKLEELHKVIEKGRTGSLTQLAERMHMPKPTLKRKLEELEALGARIEYDKCTSSFYYLNNFTFEIIITSHDA